MRGRERDWWKKRRGEGWKKKRRHKTNGTWGWQQGDSSGLIPAHVSSTTIQSHAITASIATCRLKKILMEHYQGRSELRIGQRGHAWAVNTRETRGLWWGWMGQTDTKRKQRKGQRPVEQNRLMGKATELRTHSHIHTNTETWRYIKL